MKTRLKCSSFCSLRCHTTRSLIAKLFFSLSHSVKLTIHLLWNGAGVQIRVGISVALLLPHLAAAAAGRLNLLRQVLSHILPVLPVSCCGCGPGLLSLQDSVIHCILLLHSALQFILLRGLKQGKLKFRIYMDSGEKDCTDSMRGKFVFIINLDLLKLSACTDDGFPLLHHRLL